MTIAIDPATKVITVDQADLTLISGSLYELDTNAFRKSVWDIVSAENGIFLDTPFIHNTEVTVAGTTFARTLEFINGYSITFENLTYSVRLAGSNNNIFDVENSILNPSGNVTVIAQNSAGLISVSSGSGLSAAQDTKLTEVHRDAGLDSASAKTITENTVDEDYTETSSGITKTIVKSGATTVITRT